MRRRWILIVGLASVSVAGCAPLVEMAPPSRGGPHISSLELAPDRATAGCPITMRFRADSQRGVVPLATVGWVRTQQGKPIESGYWVLPLEAGQTRAAETADLRARVMPPIGGVYRYYVQAEDEAGRKSNVLRAAMVVDGPWPWDTPRCW